MRFKDISTHNFNIMSATEDPDYIVSDDEHSMRSIDSTENDNTIPWTKLFEMNNELWNRLFESTKRESALDYNNEQLSEEVTHLGDKLLDMTNQTHKSHTYKFLWKWYGISMTLMYFLPQGSH
jgi:hypothetical protein